MTDRLALQAIPHALPDNTGCLTDIARFGDHGASGGVQPSDTSFYQNHRETKQPRSSHPLTMTSSEDVDDNAWHPAFRFDNSYVGWSGKLRVLPAGPAPCVNYPTYAYNLDAQGLRGSESGFKSRGNLTWHITPTSWSTTRSSGLQRALQSNEARQGRRT